MALPALVLVHGGGLAANSWELTINEIRRLTPELTVLAVDLPGRCAKPGDLFTVKIADFVDSVVGDIEDAGQWIEEHRRGWEQRFGRVEEIIEKKKGTSR